MKLPITYILEQMEEFIEINDAEKEVVEYLVKRPVFITDEKILKRERLYLTEQSLPENCRQETGAFLIAKETGFHIFFLREGKSILELSNQIHKLFDEAEQWYSQMKTCAETGSLKDILRLAGRYLPRYIAVMDPDFRVIERHLQDEEADRDIHGENGYLKMDIVNVLKQDAFYNAVENYQDSFLYESRGLKNRFLCINLLEDGKYRGRINVREEAGRSFRPWEGFFLNLVRDAVLPVFLRTSKSQEHTQRQRSFVRILLEGKENYMNELDLFLKDMDWQAKGKYICICLQMEQEDEREESIAYYAREIEFLMKDTVCVPFEKRIFLLHCIKGDAAEEEMINTFNYFVRECDFRSGISRVFFDITKTCSARIQAQIALDFGKQHLGWQWKYTFDEAILFYMKNCCLQELPAEFLGSAAFEILRNQDEKSGTQLYKTLICFVKNDFNMVHAADKLFIHRGTLIYRLNKIRELTKVSWDGWKDKMYLAVSVMLMETE